MRRRTFLLGSAGLGALGNSSIGAGIRATTDHGSVVFENQTTDGRTIVIADISTDINASFNLINQDSGESLARSNIEAGEYENYEIELEQQLTETAELSFSLYPSDGGSSFARELATVYVGENVELIEEIEPELIPADSAAGFNYPYFLYAPEKLNTDQVHPLLVQPTNQTQRSNDFDVHRERGRETAQRGIGQRLAGKLGTALIVPVFPLPDGDPVDRTHGVDSLDRATMEINDGPLERVDLQVLEMVNDAQTRLTDRGYSTDTEGMLLFGFSATGQFVERLSTLHPDQTVAVASGGNAIKVLPLEETVHGKLDYRVGVNNLDELIGQPFNPDAFREVDRFYFVGEYEDADTHAALPRLSNIDDLAFSLDVYGIDQIEDRLPYTKAVYDEIGANSIFRMYDGEFHRITNEMVDDMAEFFRRTLQEEDIESIRTDIGGNIPELGIRIVCSNNEPPIGEPVEFDGSWSRFKQHSIISYEWTFDDGTTATGPKVTHSFDERGGHNVVLTVEDTAGNTHTAAKQLVVGKSTATQKSTVSFKEIPREGLDRFRLTYAISSDIPSDDAERIYLFDEDEDQIVKSRELEGPGVAHGLAIMGVSGVDLTAGESVYAAILPDESSWEFDEAKQAAVAFEETEVTGATVEKLIEADPDSGFRSPYYLFIPDSAVYPDQPRPLLVETFSSGSGAPEFDRDLERVERNFNSSLAPGRRTAEALSAPLIMPAFPSYGPKEPVNGLTKLSVADTPLFERLDKQILAMIEDAQKRIRDAGYPLDESGVMLNGFSGEAQTMNRFAAIHPNEVLSVTAGGINGLPVLPVDEARDIRGKQRTLPFPIGTADIKELSGEPFDLDAYKNTNQFFYLGEIDDSDYLPYNVWRRDAHEALAEDIYGRDMQTERFPASRAIYEEVNADSVFKTYSRIGHNPRPAYEDIAEFHRRSVAGEPIKSIRSDLGGGTPNRRAAVTITPQGTRVGTQVAFHALATDLRSGDPVAFEWEFDDGHSAVGETTTHRFTTPGTHEVTLTVEDDNGNKHQATEFVHNTVSAGNEVEEPIDPTLTYTPNSPTVGETVTFDASDSNSPNGDILNYVWEIDGDDTRTGEQATYQFSTAGEHTVQLELVDEVGATTTTEFQLTIHPPEDHASGVDQVVWESVTDQSAPTNELTFQNLVDSIQAYQDGQRLNGVELSLQDLIDLIEWYQQ